MIKVSVTNQDKIQKQKILIKRKSIIYETNRYFKRKEKKSSIFKVLRCKYEKQKKSLLNIHKTLKITSTIAEKQKSCF